MFVAAHGGDDEHRAFEQRVAQRRPRDEDERLVDWRRRARRGQADEKEQSNKDGAHGVSSRCGSAGSVAARARQVVGKRSAFGRR
jgi:hypothetical protein